MVLAGGALATAACGGGEVAAQGDAGSDASLPLGFCCNASSDPCCEFSCGEGADASSYVACGQSDTECVDRGGQFGVTAQGAFECRGAGTPSGDASDAREGNPADAALPDGGPTDAADDVFFVGSCCNANPDPCCPMAYCGAAPGLEAGPYVACEQNRTQCETMGATYGYQLDGSLGCSSR